MTPRKVQEVIALYRAKLNEMGYTNPDCNYPHDKPLVFPNEVGLAHCRGMLDQMENFLAEERTDKVFRWLGFLQGCFWCTGVYTLEELKNHNRPAGEIDDPAVIEKLFGFFHLVLDPPLVIPPEVGQLLVD